MTPDRNEHGLLEKDSDPSARREAASRRWRKRTPDKRATQTDRRCGLDLEVYELQCIKPSLGLSNQSHSEPDFTMNSLTI
jgi:hypothetical protein